MSPAKMSLALTGGIASGKSTVSKLFQKYVPGMSFFDCDSCVRDLLTGDSAVNAALVEAFGVGVVNGDDSVDRNFLRKRTFEDAEARQRLEGILHPRVREDCLARRDEWAKSPESSLFVADVPLLFENGFDFGYDHSVVVAVSRETQISRIKKRNGFDDALIERILSAQLSVEQKIERGSFVLWNEGSESTLQRQLTLLLTYLQITHE